MCGIIGVASRFPIAERDWLVAGRDAMAHRGPDDAGIWWSEDRRVGLGHRRLAIIDLSLSGHQPMQDATGLLTIVFNGEIYNYQDLKRELTSKGHAFRSYSDTEVILAAYSEWGANCLLHLNGMFAFALYDEKQQAIFLGRDRAGEKPLFYSLAAGMLRFASELKGLLADSTLPRRIMPDALDCYLAMGFAPGNRCMVEGINKLPAGHAMRFDLATCSTRTWCYWKLPAAPRPTLDDSSQPDEQSLLDELENLLEDAVRRQSVADVPVGVLLSGGVDSSLITAMAVRASGQIKTFTVRFPHFSEHDETEHARLIARHFNTDHVELEASAVKPELMLLLARQFDEPIIDSSMIPTDLVSQLVRRHCTVALGGDGGDELFGGYPSYNRLLWTWQKFGWLPKLYRKAVAFSACTFLPTGFRGRNWLQALGSDLDSELPLVATFFDDVERRDLMRGHWTPFAERIRADRFPVVADLLQRATRMDFENYLTEDILVKVDRASMRHSLETRAPFLDYRVIELAFGRVPSHLKATATSRKVLLKKLTARLLPPEFDRHRKQGFSIPLAAWLKAGSWRDFMNQVLLDEQCLFDRKAVSKLLRGQAQGRANSERLFGLVLLELWRREYGVSI